MFENDFAEGPGRYIDKDGKLLCEAPFTTGKANGTVRSYFPSGKLKVLALYRNGENERGKVEFTESGSVDSLVCSANSMGPEDRELCGFDGKPVTVELDRGANRKGMYQVTHENGKLLRKKTTDRQGRDMQLTYTEPGNEDDYTAQVFFSDGKVFREYSVKRS